MEKKLLDAASKLPQTELEFSAIQPRKKPAPLRRVWPRIAAAAACLAVVMSIGFGTAEAREYRDAVQFFTDNGLVTEGLTREQLKAVYRDITTETFTYSKTAEVLVNSLFEDRVGGYEILQEDPDPEDIAKLWENKDRNKLFLTTPEARIHYKYRPEWEDTPQSTFSHSVFEKYNGQELLWSTALTDFDITGYSEVSDGVMVYGETPWDSQLPREYAWIVKLDPEGNVLWTRRLDNGFQSEYIVAILENADGSYAVFSRGDLEYFCVSQYAPDGVRSSFRKTHVGNCGILDAAIFGDGYIVRLASLQQNIFADLAVVDREGNITGYFSYQSEDQNYRISDIIEYGGKLYISTYATDKLEEGESSYGSRDEIARILEFAFNQAHFDIPSSVLTPVVRGNYTAVLLVCDAQSGVPEEFYSIPGSLGGQLAVRDDRLIWDVESITTTFFSPATSSFTIGGQCCVFCYAFDREGDLLFQEKTDRVTVFRR